MTPRAPRPPRRQDDDKRRPLTGALARRRAARLAAVQALYQIELTGVPPEAVIAEFAAHRLGREQDGIDAGPVDRALFADLVRGAVARAGELDNLVAAVLAEDWPLDRLETTLRAILRAGTYELAARPDVPARVIISEYVDLAAAFFAGKEPGIANGVLDRLARELRPDELEQAKGGRAAFAG